MYKVKVNDQFQFDVSGNEPKVVVNDVEVNLDLSILNATTSHVLYQNKSYNAEIVEFDRTEKNCKIKINGSVYEISIEDQYDQLLKQMGMDNLAANKVSEIKAPMPGLVLDVMVGENAEVKKGDNLLVLEAMKMENILKSSADGTVKKILVNKGDKVEKNQILIQFK
ncbi:acetyl-CoA carboxylase biotin carboxyl carrier protein subunit [Pedobacter chinensis]|uniref:Acetyl-CoA carboxylase biotin carboxyl carrier protein subunit n=1 Tax=Pedobacter chinensis TaxID=2282421 RepID=A0A369Q242_9SPHI|nr:acetyl-CoA carboxylase biotin carboxyl carrier protein subunit [Pedobacter chinensis]RDC57019.1 acetyl-CoA carboxylase biotin carboxyl carrier protein subunit [Pedobacter chinensis]